MPRPVPSDLEDALADSPAARERFWSMPPEQKDAWVGWVDRARMPGARRRRVRDAVQRLAGPAAAPRTTTVATNGAEPPPLPRDTWAYWLIGLLLLAVLAAFLVWFTVFRDDSSSKPSTVVVTAKTTVPGVVGIRYQAAQFQLKDQKLATKLVRRAAPKPKGIVIAQVPKAGKTVAQGTPVTLVVSKGPPGVTMPDLVGLAAADAVKALQDRKLSPVLRQVASQEAPGSVVAQQPKAGARAKPGTKVVLDIAKGAAAVSVPSVTGQSQQQATSALTSAGLKPTVVQVPSTQPQGTVVAQRPAAGQKAPKGSSVRLNVSRGPATATTTAAATTTAPATTTSPSGSGNDYTGMRLSDAVQKIADGRQQAIVTFVSSTQPAGVVVSNSRSGSREQLQVSSGPHPKPAKQVPDVTGEDAATAEHDLRAAGLSVIQVQWPVSDDTQNGKVVYETPAGGGQAPGGAAVVVYIGTTSP